MKLFSRHSQELPTIVQAFKKSLEKNSLQQFINSELDDKDALVENLSLIFEHVNLGSRIAKGPQRTGFAKLISLGLSQKNSSWGSAILELASSKNIHLLEYAWLYTEKEQRKQILVQCATSSAEPAFFANFLRLQVEGNPKYYEDATLVSALLKEPEYFKKFNRPSSTWARNIKRSDLRQYLSGESLRVVLENCQTVDDLKAIIRPNVKHLRGLITIRDTACQKLTEADWQYLLERTTDSGKRAYLLTCLASQDKKLHTKLLAVKPIVSQQSMPPVADLFADGTSFRQDDSAPIASNVSTVVLSAPIEEDSEPKTEPTADDELSDNQAEVVFAQHPDQTATSASSSPIGRPAVQNVDVEDEDDCCTEATEESDDEAEMATGNADPKTPTYNRVRQLLVQGQASPASSMATPKTVSAELSPQHQESAQGSPKQLDELEEEFMTDDGYETDDTPTSIDEDDYPELQHESQDTGAERDDDEQSTCSTASTASCDLSLG